MAHLELWCSLFLLVKWPWLFSWSNIGWERGLKIKVKSTIRMGRFVLDQRLAYHLFCTESDYIKLFWCDVGIAPYNKYENRHFIENDRSTIRRGRWPHRPKVRKSWFFHNSKICNVIFLHKVWKYWILFEISAIIFLLNIISYFYHLYGLRIILSDKNASSFSAYHVSG